MGFRGMIRCSLGLGISGESDTSVFDTHFFCFLSILFFAGLIFLRAFAFALFEGLPTLDP